MAPAGGSGAKLGSTWRGRTRPGVERGTAASVEEAAGGRTLGRVTDRGLAGVVVRAYGKFFDVQLRDEPRLLLATVKGGLRRERLKTDLVAVGDRVSVVDVGGGEGQIEAVLPRTRVLARLARGTEDVEQVILANPDQVLFLFAVRSPQPHRRMLDRFLVLAEAQGLPALIGVNKVDLDDAPAGEPSLVERTFGDYRAVYPVRPISVATGQGLDELREDLDGKMTVVAGPSGVGKSSLLNVLDPERERAVAEISTATGKGRHTTTAAQIYRLGRDTFVADTPGIRSLAMGGVPAESLDWYFPELRPYLDECFYPDCTHLHEPSCAVRAAMEEGRFSRARYESYAALRRGDGDDGSSR